MLAAQLQRAKERGEHGKGINAGRQLSINPEYKANENVRKNVNLVGKKCAGSDKKIHPVR